MNLDIEIIERVKIAIERILRETPMEFRATIAEMIDGGLN